MTSFIRGGLLLVDGETRRAEILIDRDRIAAVVPRGATPPPDATVIDATDRLVTPGFFNAHYHSHDVLLKGWFEPSPLELWVLNALPRNYAPRSLEEIRVRTLLGAVECIRSGITTVQDMVTLWPLDRERVDAVIAAYEEVGIRVVLGLQVADVPPLETSPYWRETIPTDLMPLLRGHPLDSSAIPDPLAVIEETVTGRRNALTHWAICPSSPERCSPELLARMRELAAIHALPIYTHIYISRAEAVNARRKFAAHGGSLVRFLDSLGLLGPRTTLAHGVWLDDAEIARVARSGTNVVLNTVSNLKNKNGVAPLRPMLEAGINFALGCDNCSCTDAQNIFQAMKMGALLAAVSDPRPGPPTARDMLRAATIGGARTAGLDADLGSIRPGMAADLVLFDLADPSFVPLADAARQLVYSESGRSVETVIVAGKVIMDRRKIVTINESKLRGLVNEALERFRPEAERVVANTARLAPYLLEADARVWEQELGFGRYVAYKPR